ncbi:energy transducer TonB [Flavobacterium sp.]|uniref:energy transducer TonB n=1 Tax=Flavobacterium sp. TaxID=239 RepID=UPI00262F1FBC|nr:energy transducer TonB [Flavobacterium sp.]
MKKILTIISLFYFVIGFSQVGGEDEVYLGGDAVEAKFQGGGMDKFYEFINKEFNFSKVTKAGKMVTSFSINELGEIKNIRVIEFVDVESATEIIRVLKKAPKWEPSKRGGKPISVEVKFPLVFESKVKITEVQKSTEEPTKDGNLVEEAQNDDEVVKAFELEQRPEYPGGINEFYKFVGKNFNTPDVEGVDGKIMVSFIVNKEGDLEDIKVVKDIGFGTGAEAIRVLKLSPKWKPAMQKGKPVRCAFTLPITIVFPK